MSKSTMIYDAPELTPHIIDGKWDGVTWVLNADWHFTFETDKYRLELTIRRGFITDGGSIPRVLQNWIVPLGVYLVAFLVHDALYAAEWLSRKIADWVLLEIVQALGANWVRRNAIWTAVKIGGGFVWKSHTPESIAEARQLTSGYYNGPGLSFEFGLA